MRFSLGTMQMGEGLSVYESTKLLNYFLDNGFYKIDTAQMYPVPSKKNSFLLTEKIIGRWISSLSAKDKGSLKVSTKFPNYSNKLSYLRKNNSSLITYSELKKSLTQSLKRLNLDSLETFFIHWPARVTNNFGRSYYQANGNMEEIYNQLHVTYENLSKLAKEGLCKSIGISNESALGLHCLKNTAKKNDLYIQNSYNLLNPTFDINLTEFCLATNINIQAHSPLAFGTLTGKYRSDNLPKNSRRFKYKNYFDRYVTSRSSDLIDHLFLFCDKNKIDLIELSYRYLLNNPALSEIVLGCKNIDQLNCALIAINKGPLNKEMYKEIHKILSNNPISAW